MVILCGGGMRKYKKAFTLIELLVVLAVIAVLAALIVINLNSKRRASAISALQKSASQIVTSSQLYLDDNPTTTSVNIDYLIPDYITGLAENQEIVGGIISLTGSTSNFEIRDKSGPAAGCVARVIGDEIPSADEIKTTCP